MGLRASTTFDLNGAAVTVKGMAGWRRAFGDLLPLSTMRFAGGGDQFLTAGVPIARDALWLKPASTTPFHQLRRSV
ncbi:autotransporter domain-containing protein [Ensifer sp. SSB1]|uniref:autotransporter domain-containing protein n=1 Tax=Ensifer sp. SSB1 TaxID=2795385 RepID=UPI00341EECBF